MAVTIKVNGSNLSLVHKASGGIATCTVPDVCKTPSPGGPVPIPYVIVSMSATLAKGTTTVLVDGGNMAAIKGSEFATCTGDEPGTAGGVKSSTQLKEATWITYSFDVMMDGQNACRLTDKMFMNHTNTVCLAGIVQPPVLAAHPESAAELQTLCNMMCEEKDEPGPKQQRIAERLWEIDDQMGGLSPLKAEVPFNPSTGMPYMSNNDPARATRSFAIGGSRRPDVVITNGGPPVPGNIKTVVEMKFKGDPSNAPDARERIEAYREIFGDEDVVVLEEGKTCLCEDDEDGEREPVREPVASPAPDSEPSTNYWLVGAAVVLGVATVAAAVIPFDGPAGEAALGSATAAVWGAAFAGG